MFELFKRWDDPVEDKIETLTLEAKSRGNYKQRKRTRSSRKATAQELLTFIGEKNGRPLTTAQMAKSLQVSEGYVPVLLGDLVKAGAIKRSGKLGDYRYTALRRKVDKQVRAPRKGRPAAAETPQEREVMKEAGKKIEGGRVFYSKENMDKLVKFLRRTQGEFLRVEDIASMTGLSRSTVANYIRFLKNNGQLMQSRTITGRGNQYRVKIEATIDTSPKHVDLDKVTYSPGEVMPHPVMDRDEELIREFLKFYKSKRS